MSPRSAYGDQPMTSAERVQRTRWANRVEDTSDRLLELLENAPTPLPRKPEVPAALLEKLRLFVSDELERATNPGTNRVLKPGNGHQAANKAIAMDFLTTHLGAEQVDKSTMEIEAWGTCHVAAYTHEKGAMISTPNRESGEYGGRPWHSRDHIIMFRDLGAGRCKIYISKIAPLFEHRTIGRGGVTWENVEKLCEHSETVSADDVFKAIG